MKFRLPRPASLTSGLFWRTFLLLSVLTTLSMSAWFGMVNYAQREPLAQQTAAQVVSVVTITRAALTHSATDLRRELLFELVSNEGIRVFTMEDDDVVEPPPNKGLMADIQLLVKAKLGADTRFSSEVNGVPGYWVSFKIADDRYWLMLERERLQGPVEWLGWAGVVSLVSLLGAALISSLINLPLKRLSAAARDIAQDRPAGSAPGQPQLQPDGGRPAAGGVGPRRDPGRHFARPAHAARAHAAGSGNGQSVAGGARRHAIRYCADGCDHCPIPRLRQADRGVELHQCRPGRPAVGLRARSRPPQRRAHYG
jgi:hypothetical protein